jgi:hypothetical protein
LVLLVLSFGCLGPTGWIDRIEGEVVVVVTEDPQVGFRQRDMPRRWFPFEIHEGDWVLFGIPVAQVREAMRERMANFR